MAMMSYGFDDSVFHPHDYNDTLSITKVIHCFVTWKHNWLWDTIILQLIMQCQDFKFEYADEGDIPVELFWRGMISLTLTCVNIVCIVMVGVLMLLVKQVMTNILCKLTSLDYKLTSLSTRLSEISLLTVKRVT